MKASIDDVRLHPCPTCKMPSGSLCVDVDENGEGGSPVTAVHSTRIDRYRVVTEAIAHNQEVEAMTDIAVPDQQPTSTLATAGNLDHLGRWLQQADAVFAIAERICDTSFVPTAYRKKPAEAAAAMLAGAELGFDPMASLRAFDSINGTPAPKAITLRAVVLGKGHEVETVEQSATRAVVRGRRFGKGEWQTSTWDIERAKKLPQFKTNANYVNNPEAMLVARATAEVCRWVGPDAVMGMPYAAEELDGEQSIAARPTARRLLVADLDEPAPAAIEADGPITAEQRTDMAKLWDLLGYTGDENREMRLQVTARILGLGKELESSDELTRVEADQVITALRERLRQAVRERLRQAGGQDA